MVGLRTDDGWREEAIATRALKKARSRALMTSPHFDRFAVLPSNLNAVESALLFSTEISPLVLIAGPSGWGKTHLLQIAAEQCEREVGRRVAPVAASAFLLRGGRWDQPGPLMLDDVQVCLKQTRERQLLRSALEVRVRLRRPTLLNVTAEKISKVAEGILPSLHQWSLVELPAPIAEERQVVLRRLAAIEGLELSDRLIRALANLISGSGHAILGVVQRLGIVQKRWIGLPAELQAIAVARPFLTTDFDLRELVDRTVTETIEPLSLEMCEELGSCVAVYVLRRIADLGEEEIAAYFSIEPGDVFSYLTAFEGALEDPRVQRLTRICLETLHEALNRL